MPAYCGVREPEPIPFTPLAPLLEPGATATGWVAEQPIPGLGRSGQAVVWRRLRGLLQKPPRTGDDHGYRWTPLPVAVTAATVARRDLKRGRIATAVQPLAQEVNTAIQP